MAGKTWAFEDLAEGATLDLGSKLVTAEEIVEFATEFDAQPMHLSEEAGKQSILGGLSASGWHTCAIFMRLLCDAFLLDSTSQGSPGIDHVKWKKPVLAGDTLTGRCTVLGKRLSKSRPGLGLVHMRAELVNQRGEGVFELENAGMFLTREGAGS
jgi:acyl dehydratase